MGKNKSLIKDEGFFEDERCKSRKIIYLLFLLLMTGLLLSTSSYAWFTTNRVVTLDTLNVKVQTEGSLEISVDGINWKASINQDEIISANATYPMSINQIPNLIDPVSTAGGLNELGLLNMYLGKIISNSNGDYILTATKSEEKDSSGDELEGKFIAFDIFLKVTDSKVLYLTGDSNITYNGDISVGTENAMRGAFIVEGNTLAGDNINNIQSLKTTNSNNVYIWEPNYDVHTSNGVNNARDLYGITTSIMNASRISYDGVIAEINGEDNIVLSDANVNLYPDKFMTVVPKIVTSSDNSTYQELFVLNSGITKLRIYFWLEGQDVDCENNASVGDLSIVLKLSTNPA